MNILVVTSGLVPYPGLQGSTVHVWSVLTAIRDLGHTVSVAILRRNTQYDDEKKGQPLKEAGVSFHFLTVEKDPEASMSWSTYLDFSLHGSYSEDLFTSELENLVKKIQPDALLLFTARTVAATSSGFNWPPRFAFTTDLDHVARIERLVFNLRYGQGLRRYATAPFEFMKHLAMARHHVRLLKQCEFVFNHAAHHTSWLKNRGVRRILYLPVPIMDCGGKVALEKSLCGAPRNKIKIMMIGTTRGIATLSGFPPLIRKILPSLDAKFQKSYELHIVGIFQGLPADLEKKLRQHPNVVIRGYVENIDEAFKEADVILVPTPVHLGFRVRIAEAFSYGSCVVAHSANGSGMPELIHGENILFADDGTTTAEACAQVFQNAELRRRMSAAARQTFERHYEAKNVCRKMVKKMEEILNEKCQTGAGK